MQDKGVFCNARVKWDGKTFVTEEEQWEIDYEMPNYTSVKLDIERKSKSKIMSFDDPIKSIKMGNIIIGEGCEADTILLAVKQLRHIDADVIYTNKGDSVCFPYLIHRARLHGIQNRLTLGRDQNRG